jgi:2',3'-cyclic-nucleotide 2'-phosphodiesterase/3'-nucleotidase/5'-nucleotidase
MLRLINGGAHPKTGEFEGADFPYVAANVEYKESGDLVLDPYVIKEVDGVKIGIIGVVTTITPNIVIPSAVKDVKFTDEVTAINKYTAELKTKGVEAIVVLAHNPGSSKTDGTGAAGEVIDFANEVDDEVDVIYGGHDHKYLKSTIDNKLVVQSWSYGTAFSDIDLVIDPITKDIVMDKSKAEIVDTIHSKIAPDAKIAAELTAYKEAIAPILNESIGEAGVELTRSANEHGEQVLGNVIADAMRAEMDTDMAFMNPGGIRNDLNAGEITWGELFNVQPFGNDLIKMTVTGDIIRELLNQQWADPTRAKMLQISGLFYEFDDTLEYGKRILDIYLEDGTPIDPKAEYTITVNNFMAGGGDGYQALLKGTNSVQGPTDLDGLINYVKNYEGPIFGEYEYRMVNINYFEEIEPGWHQDGENWYYVHPETGELVVDEWEFINNKWYFFNEDAVMETGWFQEGNKWYYLDAVNGDMKTDWFRVSNKWYFFNGSGVMKTGWLNSNNTWYFLGSDGVMKTGWVFTGKKWYFLDSKGAMETGWVYTDKKWYYLNANGAMATGWVKVGTKWYFLYDNGSMAANTTVGKYKVGSDGAWIK